MAGPSRLATTYATDEDLAIRCDGDIKVLMPNSSLLAAGKDGVFLASDPWTLTSASNSFQSQGVKVGHVVSLVSASSPTSKPWGGTGSLFAVGASVGGSLTLRRLGLADGLGLPPGEGGFTGVEFSIQTLGPQIEQASDDLNRRFKIDPASATRAPSALYDLRELNEACMLTVLLNKYATNMKTENGAYPIKLKLMQVELADSLSRLQLRWGVNPDAPPPVPVQFGTRYGR